VDRASFEACIRAQVYWITRRIALGPFATEARGRVLRDAGVTHILNVGAAPSLLRPEPGGFLEVAWQSIEDLCRIPDDVALACLDTLHHMLGLPGSKVYLHCTAGQNRSPTVLWLYFLALGLEPADARRRIEGRTLDAVAGHRRMIDDDLVALARHHGQRHFDPAGRDDLLAPPRIDD
jgi:protein-tyrosine phosphatase